jgi:hypothetical protein
VPKRRYADPALNLAVALWRNVDRSLFWPKHYCTQKVEFDAYEAKAYGNVLAYICDLLADGEVQKARELLGHAAARFPN